MTLSNAGSNANGPWGTSPVWGLQVLTNLVIPPLTVLGNHYHHVRRVVHARKVLW